ncbi:MAG: hypothetical protein JSV94_05665, partial [Methanobacteriota archaeon]
VNLTDIGEGEHTLIVRAYDYAGLKSEETLSFTVHIESELLGMSLVSLVIIASSLVAAAIVIFAVIMKRRGPRSS